jgi:DNA-binding HxlR family transcriptional regulator
LPTNKTEELMKPFAGIELKTLSKFLKSLKKNGTLDAVLNYKD